jgi:hypothetical protein
MTNGTVGAVRKWTLDLGKVDANGRGRKANRVTLEVELRRKVNDVSPYLDIDLKPCKEYTELSICGAVWNAAGSDHQSGGQNHETIAKLFPDNAKVQRLVEIWERYHLGGMNSGTRRQRDFLKDARVKAVYPQSQYDLDCKTLEKANLLWVTNMPVTPITDTTPPYRNYKYGEAWLVEALPADVEAEVDRLCWELTNEREATAPESDPKNFAQEHGVHADTERADSNPNMVDGSRDMHHWKVTLRRGKARLTVYFSQGSAHTKPPTAMDVLGCLASDASGAEESFEEWCSNLGEDTDSRKAKKTYDVVRKQTEKLKNFLGGALFTTLIEDSNG